MSGGPIWAFTEPSANSTIEWMVLCGWTTTSILSQGTPNSQWVSITSNALFISVAESIVIFLPIVQVGCCRARSGVTDSISSSGVVRKGPPEAVISNLRISLSSPRRHCQMALGSLSTGRTSPP